jgi:hypothetical protein
MLVQKQNELEKKMMEQDLKIDQKILDLDDDDLADSEATPNRYSYASLPDHAAGGDFWEEIETKLKTHVIGGEGHVHSEPQSSGRLTDPANLQKVIVGTHVDDKTAASFQDVRQAYQ